MRFFHFIFIGIISLHSYSVQGQNPGDQIFDQAILHEVRFEFSQTGFMDSLSANYEDNAFSGLDVPYMMGTVSLDGMLVDSVGVRFKGFSSYQVGSHKKSIKIDFNEYVVGKRFDGLRKLNVNNAFGDPGMQREAVCYDLLGSMEVGASRTSYAKIYFNNEYYGLYLLVEQVDREFLGEHFGNNAGNLFKNKGWNSLSPDFGSSLDFVQENFDLKTNESVADWSGFANFIDVLNDSPDNVFKDAIQEVFNVDLFLRVLAVDVATGNWDSYLYHGRNWYLYEDLETGIFHWIPWDYNLALGGSFSGFSEPIWDFSIDDPATDGSFGGDKVLINRLLAVPEFKSLYLDYFCRLLGNEFTSEKYDAFIHQNRLLIDSAFQAETLGIFSYEQFSMDIGNGNASLKSAIASQLASKNAELGILVECAGPIADIDFQHVVINEFVASNDSTSNIADSHGEYDDWIELFNNTSSPIDLSESYLSDDAGQLYKWKFPLGTTIPENGYLIIWADKDEGQSGLHCDFKLSKNGESIYFINEDGSYIDSVSYAEQSTNIALARIPNGTGNFIQRETTFNYNNEDLNSTTDILSGLASSIYPNPASDVLNIQFEENIDNYSINIYSLHGKQLLGITANSSKHIELDVNSLNAGVYILRIDDPKSGGYDVYRFVKR